MTGGLDDLIPLLLLETVTPMDSRELESRLVAAVCRSRDENGRLVECVLPADAIQQACSFAASIATLSRPPEFIGHSFGWHIRVIEDVYADASNIFTVVDWADTAAAAAMAIVQSLDRGSREVELCCVRCSDETRLRLSRVLQGYSDRSDGSLFTGVSQTRGRWIVRVTWAENYGHTL